MRTQFTNSGTDTVVLRVPWLTTVTAMIALGTLIKVAHVEQVVLAPVLIVAFLATYYYRSRLDNTTPLRWIIRVLLIATAYFTTRQAASTLVDYAVGPAWSRNFFGLIYAGEMTIQAWRTRTDNPKALLAILFWSGVVVTTAANTFNDSLIRFIAPIYLLFLFLSLRNYRRHQPIGGIRSRRTEHMATAVRVSALVVTFGTGFGGYHLFQVYRGEITDWGNNLLLQRLSQIMDTGMSEQPTLGPTFGLRGSPARVLRLTGANGGIVGDPHLRGMSFDRYEMGRWSPRVTDRVYVTPADPDMRIRTHPGDPAIGPTSIVRVSRLVRDNPLVFAPLSASEIDLTDADNLQWSPTTNGPIRTTSPPPFSYTVSIPNQETFQGILAGRLTDKERAICLEVPKTLDPGVAALAHRITKDSPTPAHKIAAITEYLLTTHRYSLRIDPGSGDPISGFLLSNPPKGAHCEYFASGAALLLRCVGVPTRYVTGYYAHETEDATTAIVRQRDAHAWAEAWLDGVGWVTVEATPEDGLPDFKPEPISRWQALTERFQDLVQAIKDRLGDLKPEQITLMLVALTGILVVGTVIWAILQRRRSGAVETVTQRRYTLPSEELAAIAERFERLLTNAHLDLPESRTLQEHLTRLETLAALAPPSPEPDAEALQRLLALTRRFIVLYERARFGDPEIPESTLAALRELLNTLEAIPLPRTLPVHLIEGTPAPPA